LARPRSHFIAFERGKGFEQGNPWILVAVRVIDAGKLAHDECTVHAGVLYGSKGDAARRILLSDTSGRWPGDPGCQEPYASILNGKSRH
jgi:hypothetical protein